jgi:hypothetical protein
LFECLPYRLQTLNPELQSTIYHKVGRHTRRVSRLWKQTYGPLDCGLQLQHINTKADIDRLLAQDPHRFHHITALLLKADTPFRDPIPTDMIRSLPAAFPKLRSLDLSHKGHATVSAADLQPMTVLRSCLTSLALPNVSPFLPSIAHVMQLTSLRSLRLDCPVAYMSDAAQALQGLSTLPHLRQLRFGADRYKEYHPASPLLASLRCLDLTDLGLHLALAAWDHKAIDALRTAMPQLTALTLCMALGGGEQGDHNASPAFNRGVMAALAQRTALRSLELDLEELPEELHNLHALSALQLNQLRVTAYPEDAVKLGALLEALTTQQALTSLSLDEDQSRSATLSQRDVDHLSCIAGGLEEFSMCTAFDPEGGFFAVLATMQRLKKLALHGMGTHPVLDEVDWHEVADALAALTTLEVLEVKHDGGEFVTGALWAMGELTNLRQLTLQDCKSTESDEEDEYEVDIEEAMWQLALRKHSLTRLALGVTGGLTAPTLCGVLGRMTALQHLEFLRNMGDVLQQPLILTELLQPLPPRLRMLEFHDCALPPLFRETVLKPMADLQECTVRVTSDGGWWDT